MNQKRISRNKNYGKKILLTRNKNISEDTVKNLRQKGFNTLIQPLFSVVRSKNISKKNLLDITQKITKQKLQAVLLTSVNAVFALKELSITDDILIFTVGKKTAEITKNLGYKNVIFANNSANSLLNLAEEKLDKKQGLIIYLCGEIVTINLAQELKNKGFASKKIITYKVKEKQKITKKNIDQIAKNKVSEIWIYSKNSVKIFYQLAIKHNLLVHLEKTKILCLSKEIANFAKEIGFLNTEIIK